MTQIERIGRMERIYDEAAEAIENLAQALEWYLALKDERAELEAYYTGPQWMQDYADDCAGKLPQTLKRGVLCEDAVYDLLSENDRLLKIMRVIG